MRLKVLENGHKGLAKWLIRFIRRTAGTTPGPVAVAHYNRPFFGAAWNPCIRQGLEKSRHWSRGEAELIAAFVSRMNECRY